MSRKSNLKLELVRHILRAGKSTRPELVAVTGSRAATVFEVIDELKDSIYENKESGKTIIDIDQFKTALAEAGYTKDEIDQLGHIVGDGVKDIKEQVDSAQESQKGEK